ncbi:hypothetical protein MICA_578 [Micavibrio aeruginosavorus ARL-13]|uniref:Uncharacterized protein n=1 Tax=Micavibrio aeruginosavorus (strain ARL-13) TaxID=856793 RepID=G2KMY3_MICAA|nr:hypothetical protein MICA_578 [Micavibrio aeruginosavorus ARL-13]
MTLNFWTPLEYLKMHGVLFKTPEETFEINPRFGAWIPYLGETSTPSPHASVFGLVIPDEVLPILMHYREIVEADFPPDEKFRRLQKMTADDTNPNWLRHIQYALHGKYSDMAEYWAINDLTSLQGVGPAKARKLIGRGIYTADQILQ